MTAQTAPDTTEPDGRAEAAAAYMAMLRRIHEVSGLTAGQMLPKNRSQVEAFLHACRLPQRSVERMLELWDDVSGNARRPDTTASHIRLELPIDPLPTPEETELSWQEWEEDLSARRDASPRTRASGSIPASATQSNPPPDEDLILPTGQAGATYSYNEPCLCLDLVHRLQVPRQQPASHSRGTRRTWTRVAALAMLILALYPLAAAVWFGHLVVDGFNGILAATVAVGLLLILTSRSHRYLQHTTGLTPTWLAGGVLSGICSGVLAWTAVPALPVAVVTGFVVFAMVPIWLSLTEWTSLVTAPGVFIVIAGLWCGATLGTAVGYTGFPSTGSVLVGTLGAATAIALLSSNLHQPEPTAWSRLTRRPSIPSR